MFYMFSLPLIADNLSNDMLSVVRGELDDVMSMVPEQAGGVLKSIDEANYNDFMPLTHIIASLRSDDVCCMAQKLGLSDQSVIECWFKGLVDQGRDSRQYQLTYDWVRSFIDKSQHPDFSPTPLKQLPVDWLDVVGKCGHCDTILSCHDKLYADGDALTCGCGGEQLILIDMLGLEGDIIPEDCFSMPVLYKGVRYQIGCAYHKSDNFIGFKGKDFDKGQFSVFNKPLADAVGWDGVYGALKVAWDAYFHGV